MLKQVGTAAVRSPSGEFVKSEPIYRDIPENAKPKQGKIYINEDTLYNLFASKCEAYVKEAKKEKWKQSST